MDWIYRQTEESLFLSVITMGELIRGFSLLPPGARRMRLEAWFHEGLIPRFESRILPVNYMIAERWGVIDAQAQQRGRPISTADGLIAATALEYDFTVVTRNIRDFEIFGVSLLNPWPTA